MPITEAQRRANSKYDKENYEYCTVKVKKGRKAEIKAAAAAQNESVNGFISTAIDERVERLGASQGCSLPWTVPGQGGQQAQRGGLITPPSTLNK